MNINTTFENRRLRKGLKRLYADKYCDSLNSEMPNSKAYVRLCNLYEEESAPLRARLREIESADLVDKAMSYGIVIADLVPLRFRNPLWQEEAGCRYLSVEGKQTVKRAISNSRREALKFWFPTVVIPLTGLLGVLTGLIAIIAH